MTEAIRRILELARWSPSGDNQQTWRFHIDGNNRFTVHAWDTRRHCVYDLLGHASQIALGGLMETIRIAATRERLVPLVTRIETGQEARYEFAIDLVEDATVVPDPLAEFIPLRSVQRRAMRTTPLTAQQRAVIERAAGDRYEVVWFASLAERFNVARLLFKSAELRLTIPEAYATHATVIEWRARFSETRVPDQAVGLDPVSTRLMEWTLQSWQRVRFLNRFLGGTLLPRVQLDLVPGLCCGAHFLLLAAAPPHTLEDYMQAGAAWLRSWLAATASGLCEQPEMTPLIFREYARDGVRFSVDPDAPMRAGAIRGDFERLIGTARAERAIVMGRIGAGPPSSARSLRRPLDEMIIETREDLPST